MSFRACCLFVPLFATLLAAQPTLAEIYADFTTSHGSFTVELDALRAPRAVANFIGLVDGTRTWRDPTTGAVRGGAAGDGFYAGMRFYATAGTVALLGGFRPYAGSDGNEYWDGPGYTILDEATNGVALARGVLAAPIFDGPHSGGGELALMLTSIPPGNGWTAFGAVTGAGMAVVDAVANDVTNGSGRVAAQIAIRTAGVTPEETAALDAVRGELPTIEAMPLGFASASNATCSLAFWSVPNSQACLATASNLPANQWSVLPGDWNTGTNAVSKSVPLAAIPGMTNANGNLRPRGFLYGSQAHYPKMTAGLLSGKQHLAMAHTGTNYQYWLDFAGGTGIWGNVVSNMPVPRGNIDWVGQEMGTANSLHLVLFIGSTAYHYWLGFDEAEAMAGRFYCEFYYLNVELRGTDNGTFEWTEGWPSQSLATQGKPVRQVLDHGISESMSSMEAGNTLRRRPQGGLRSRRGIDSSMDWKTGCP